MIFWRIPQILSKGIGLYQTPTWRRSHQSSLIVSLCDYHFHTHTHICPLIHSAVNPAAETCHTWLETKPKVLLSHLSALCLSLPSLQLMQTPDRSACGALNLPRRRSSVSQTSRDARHVVMFLGLSIFDEQAERERHHSGIWVIQGHTCGFLLQLCFI